MSDIDLTDSDIEVQPHQVNQRAASEAAARAAALHSELSDSSSTDSSSDESSDGEEYVMDNDTVAFYRSPRLAPGLYIIRPENVPDGFFKLYVDQDGRERIVFHRHDRRNRFLRNAFFRRIDRPGLGIIQRPRIHFWPIRFDPRRNDR